MTELEEALVLADKVLDRPNADPDDDLAILARHLLRAHEQNRARYAMGFNDGMEEHRARIGRINAWLEEVREKYLELLLAVGNKWPEESRHETALRYIRQAESKPSQESAS